jgi:hypothetical protein
MASARFVADGAAMQNLTAICRSAMGDDLSSARLSDSDVPTTIRGPLPSRAQRLAIFAAQPAVRQAGGLPSRSTRVNMAGRTCPSHRKKKVPAARYVRF